MERVKCTINPRDYFGEFALPDQEIIVEGIVLVAREKFMGSDNAILVVLQDGQDNPVVVSINRCKSIEVLSE